MILNIYPYFIYLYFLNVFEDRDVRILPVLLRCHPYGYLSIPRTPQNLGNGEWLWIGSGKLLLTFASTVILGSRPRGTPDDIFLFHDSDSNSNCSGLFCGQL
jgi:hypothetical protein